MLMHSACHRIQQQGKISQDSLHKMFLQQQQQQPQQTRKRLRAHRGAHTHKHAHIFMLKTNREEQDLKANKQVTM